MQPPWPVVWTVTMVWTMVTWSVEAARILAVVPSSAPSHHMVIQPILRAVAEAGHEVVVYSIHRIHDPPSNYKEISLVTDESGRFNRTELVLNALNASPWNCFFHLFDVHKVFMFRTFENEHIKNLLKSNEQFDLVFIEPFVAQEFAFIFGYKFNAPVIGIQTFVTSFMADIHLGNSLSLTFRPALCLGHSDRMTFYQRILNTVFHVRKMYLYHYDYLPSVEKKLKAYFPDMPPLRELMKTLSLMFINEHPTADYSLSRPPTSIPVAGVHLQSPRPLPSNIKSFMDDSENGVILFSLGSWIPDEFKTRDFFENIVGAFRKLRQRVIWKTRKENVTELPDNVMVVQWMPQRDILAHPNCVLFITHGGQASQYEAIYNAVPVVGIPHFGDQHRNVEFYVAKEVGVKLMPEDLSEETLIQAINSVMDNQKYRDNMKRLSRIFRDTPMSPKQAVVYWTEYVLRHGGAPHLKSMNVELQWYQEYLLDVIALIALTFFSLCFISCLGIRTVFLYLKHKRHSTIR